MDQFYLLSASLHPTNRVMAFGLNGTNLCNFTDPRIGSINSLSQYNGWIYPVDPTLVRVYNNSHYSLAVTDPANHRIALLDLVTGVFFDNITLPNNTFPVAAYHDGQYWYRAELTLVGMPDYERYSSIKQYSLDGSGVVAQYVLDSRGEDGYPFTMLCVDRARQRLYGSNWAEGMAWWTLPRMGELHSASSASLSLRRSARVRAE